MLLHHRRHLAVVACAIPAAAALAIACYPGDELNVADTDVVARCIPSLPLLVRQDWETFYESASLVELILGLDPAGIYPRMDFDTRNRYRTVIEALARATGQAEVHIAHVVVEMAEAITWRQTEDGLVLSVPREKPCRYAFVYRIDFKEE